MSSPKNTARQARKKGTTARLSRGLHPRDEVQLSRKNWAILLAALLVIVVGYVFLANGSITVAPILLVLGYCVMIPYAILARD